MPKGERITSRQNPRLAFARSVRDGRDSSFIFVEGARLVEEAVGSGIVIRECFAADDFEGWGRFAHLESEAVPVKRSAFDSISATENSQGIIVIAERPRHSVADAMSAVRSASVLVAVYLHKVNNPSNLGAVMRSAEAAGAAAILTSKGSADAYSPKSLRAAMGSAFRLKVVEGVDLSELRASGDLIVTAIDTKGAAAYTDIDWTRPRILMFGSEAHGLSDDELKAANETIAIQMDPSVESLNLAVSVGIILFEARRQTTNG